jgi:hypothetical protein
MKFRYRDYLIELLVLGIEYPSYPCEKGERAVTTWQVLIEGEEPRIKKGTKKEIIDQVKKYIREINGEDFSFDDEEEF